MPRPRIRLRLWWIMALIAAIGLGLAVWIEAPRFRRLSRDYHARALRYAEREKRAVATLKSQRENHAFWSALAAEREKMPDAVLLPRLPTVPDDAIETRAEIVARTKEQAAWHAREAAFWQKKTDHFARLRQKWDRLAAFPWLPAEPDPPEP